MEAETNPLIKRIFIPRSALLSPAHRFYPAVEGAHITMNVIDDVEYDPRPLTDDEFAAALPAGAALMKPEVFGPTT